MSDGTLALIGQPLTPDMVEPAGHEPPTLVYGQVAAPSGQNPETKDTSFVA